MSKFSEILKSVNDQLDSFITKDTPTEQITQIGKVKEELTKLGDAHKQTLDDYGELKDRYIDAVKHFGTGKAPANEVDANQGKTMEEIGAEIISNRGTK